jgi:succinyl-diaminopimelate desuccinylase
LGAVIDPLRAAREDYDAVVRLTRELVRVPSRGGIDPYDPVLECMAAWLGEHGLASCRLAGPAVRRWR